MNEDYLWDGSGPPDPDIAKLEDLLAPKRYHAAPEPGRMAWRRVVTVAAVLLLAVGAVALWGGDGDETVSGPQGRCYAVAMGDETWEVGRNETVSTPNKAARVEISDIGSIDVKPGSELRVIDPGETAHHLYLEHGAVEVRIDLLRPRSFLIGTPAGLAVDLGCHYTLEVKRDGTTRLSVMSGKVAFETDFRDVFVPAGASCTGKPGEGPTTPVWNTCGPSLSKAVTALDGPTCSDGSALPRLLSTQDASDTLMLWHLLDVIRDRATKEKIVDHIAKLVEIPSGVTRDGILDGDAKERELYAQVLKLFW